MISYLANNIDMEDSVDCVICSQNPPDREFCTKRDKTNRILCIAKINVIRYNACVLPDAAARALASFLAIFVRTAQFAL